MKSLYNEYLTGVEREAAIIVAESDAQFAKLNVLMETVDATLEANKLAAEAKVFAENGTYDDLTMLYTEAEQEAAQKKQGILATIANAISTLINKIRNFITEKFGKNVSEKLKELPEDDVTVDKSINEKFNIFKKGWDLLKGSVEKIKSGNYNGIGDVMAAWGPLVTAFGAITAGTATVVIKRNEIAERVDFIKDTVLTSVNAAVNALKVVVGASNVAKAVVDTTTNAQAHGKFLTDDQIMKLEKVLKALQKFHGMISGWLGNLYSALPFTKDAVKDKDGKRVNKKDLRNKGKEIADAGQTDRPENHLDHDYSSDGYAESVSIFGVEIDDDIFTESEISDEEFNELCEAFSEL